MSALRLTTMETIRAVATDGALATRGGSRLRALTRRSALRLILLSAILGGCSKHPEESTPDAAVSVTGTSVTFAASPEGIRTVAAEEGGNAALSLPGRLSWNEDRTVRVFSPFTGRVIRVMAAIGDTVQAGQPVAELASPDFGQAQTDARKAATDLALARQTLNRAQALNTAGVVAQKDLQQAQADVSRADAENARTQTRLRQVGAGNGQNFLLKAPIGGVVVDKSINPGQELRSDQSAPPLFVITDPAQLWVWIDAPESEIAHLPAGSSRTALTITSAAYAGETFPASLVGSQDFIDPVSRTFKLRGVVDNPRRLLKAEMFVTASLPLSSAATTATAKMIPTAALMLMGERRYVFVKAGENRYTRVEIQVLREEPDHATVIGLPTGKAVVVEGNLYLLQYLQNAVAVASPATTNPADRNTTSAGQDTPAADKS